MIGRLTRVQERELQARLVAIRSNFLQLIKDRTFTSGEKGEVSSRLGFLEREINRVWYKHINPMHWGNPGSYRA
jgi:hypothetical protein